jgi:hypothetical protein
MFASATEERTYPDWLPSLRQISSEEAKQMALPKDSAILRATRDVILTP